MALFDKNKGEYNALDGWRILLHRNESIKVNPIIFNVHFDCFSSGFSTVHWIGWTDV